MSQIILHGTGSGNPSGDRGASAASVRFSDGTVLLLDAGEGCSRALLRDGVPLNDIVAVVVSHMHADHWAGLPNLIMGWALGKRTAPVDLYLPPGSLSFFKRVFQTSYILHERLSFVLHLHELCALSLPDGFALRPFATSHLDKYQVLAQEFMLSFPAFGYVLEKEGRKILFSQDIGSERDLIEELPGCHLVVCELTHIDPARFLILAAKAGVERVVFTHVPPAIPQMPDVQPGLEWSIAADGTVLPLE